MRETVKLSWRQIRRVVEVQVGLAGSQRDIFFITLK
jgi:hypothetical protein